MSRKILVYKTGYNAHFFYRGKILELFRLKKSQTWFQLTQADLLYLSAVAGRVQCSPLSLYGGRLSHLCIPKLDKIP